MEKAHGPHVVIRDAIETAIKLGELNRPTVLLTMRDFVDRGQMDAARRDALLVPTIRKITEHLAPHSTLDTQSLNMAVFGVILLLGRFIAFTDDDLHRVVWMPDTDHSVIDGLTDLALRMLGLPATASSNQ